MLATNVAGIPLACCIYNASGPRTNTQNMLLAIGRSASGAVLAKSATLLPQTGNPLPRYIERDLGPGLCMGSMNSEGLPNKGIDAYIRMAQPVVDDCKKPYFLSLSGLKLKDNVAMLQKVVDSKAPITAVELNIACPNVPNKPIIGYDFEQMQKVLTTVSKIHLPCPLGIKLPPYFDMPQQKQASAIINSFPNIKFVVCTNTIGNALIVDADKEEAVIAPKGGFGGLAGGYVKQIALANVRRLSLLLRPDIAVIGAGGISTGTDAFEFILCGATAVQVGTCHRVEGPGCFDRISSELSTLMQKKGYKTLADFRGKLANRGDGPKSRM